MKILFPLIALALSAAAHAQVYKCQDGGRTVYSQEPCSGRAEVIDVTPATGGYDAIAAASPLVELPQEFDRFSRRHFPSPRAPDSTRRCPWPFQKLRYT